jgi:hypothetical protein
MFNSLLSTTGCHVLAWLTLLIILSWFTQHRPSQSFPGIFFYLRKRIISLCDSRSYEAKIQDSFTTLFITCVNLGLLNSRYRGGLRHGRDFLGKHQGRMKQRELELGKESLRRQCRSDTSRGRGGRRRAAAEESPTIAHSSKKVLARSMGSCQAWLPIRRPGQQ